MPTPHVCLALAFALVYVPLLARAIAPAAAWGRRAKQAYATAAVAFPGFAAAVMVALLGEADARRTSVLCVAYVVVRALHVPATLLDVPFTRRALWALGLLITFALFALPALS